jgi:hypothetical protein
MLDEKFKFVCSGRKVTGCSNLELGINNVVVLLEQQDVFLKLTVYLDLY